MKLFIRAKILRATMMASTTTVRPGEVSTMSAAARAASVAPCTAIPMSARFKAGASFTPSPVMPTSKPPMRSASTMTNLCSGNTWAKPLQSTTRWQMSAISAPLGSLPSESSVGRPSQPRMLVPMSSTRAVSLAMTWWSPVTIFTSTPCTRARSMVSLVSGRGGSRKVSTPRNCQRPPWSVRATASERMPRSASSSTFPSTAAWMRALSAQSASTMCGAPLVTLNSRPSGPCRAASVRLSVGSKGVYSSCV
mmetsp:Transcript_19942/g.31368  ORF Transcript_19942/g.31368 Transcript_19942/m.31368 type:complete len:251 (+) Transcript_19942:1086-1838(+)